MIDTQRIATTRPPAKLNFFLELMRRREDGYHDIDTVMAAIDWCDRLSIRRTHEPGVRLHCDWVPSEVVIGNQLGIEQSSRTSLQIPTDDTNLIGKALNEFISHFAIDGGFECWLDKRIPAGAGMGGASSDAASALICAAGLCRIHQRGDELHTIAARIGSDVPFFLGPVNTNEHQDSAIFAARAQGRGTEITPISIGFLPSLVVAYPGIGLSTAKVYGKSSVPDDPESADGFLNAWKQGDQQRFYQRRMNRLGNPARKLVPQIDEILESMWRYGAITCQLTGSGSACFAVVANQRCARSMTKRLQATCRKPIRKVQPLVSDSNERRSSSGILARSATLRSVPASVEYRIL